MLRRSLGMTLILALCFTAPVAFAQRGKGEKPGGEKGKSEPQGKKPGGEEKPGGESRGGSKPPGGAWSENKKPAGNPSREHEPENKPKSPNTNEGTEAAAERAAKNKSPQATGAQGAAAGAAAANRDKPATSGATGAAAGAAAANRNNPAATGAQGAAAGAAAANRNNPAASGAQGAAAGAAVAERNQPLAAGAVPTAAGYAAVRNSFNHPDVYSQQWYGQHQGAWAATNWAAGSIWAPTTMAGASGYLGYANNTPVSYGYGSNVVYQQGNVLVDGQSVGTAEHFSQQAADLALVGQNADISDTQDWLPLGVFALVRDEDQHAQLTLQLAVNKQGILRGNYNDVVIDHVLPVHGAVDKETQRAAWTVDNNKNFFMEAGLSNLTTGEAPTLIHKSGRTERWLLVRLPQPEAQQ
jgi:hypothetical protein